MGKPFWRAHLSVRIAGVLWAASWSGCTGSIGASHQVATDGPLAVDGRSLDGGNSVPDLQEAGPLIDSQAPPIADAAPPAADSAVVSLCPGLTPGSSSAATQLQSCIDNTPAGGTLAIPPGTHLMTAPVEVNKPMTLRTRGTEGVTVPCLHYSSPPPCARLLASSSLTITEGFFRLRGSGAVIEHLVIDGNRGNRLSSTAASQCAGGNNRYGFNATAQGDGHTFRYNASINALCGTGLEWHGSNATITNNLFFDNGENGKKFMWADGLTVLRAHNSTVANNECFNNTDIGLILGGAAGSTVTGNIIQQDFRFAFAGLMLDNFNGTQDGDFRNTTVSGNTVNCGDYLCDYGINIGPHAWYTSSNTLGGEVTGNQVNKAKIGILVEGGGTAAAPARVHHNTVTGWAGPTTLACGKAITGSLWNISPDSVVDRAGDATPYTTKTIHTCP